MELLIYCKNSKLSQCNEWPIKVKTRFEKTIAMISIEIIILHEILATDFKTDMSFSGILLKCITEVEGLKCHLI
jgi:hypothetical protein